MTQAYPLHWPKEWPRTTKTGSSQFKTSLSGALNNVQKALAHFSNDSGKKIENMVISSNVTLGEQKPSDPGVAIYFTWDGITTCIAVDRYTKVEDNLQAIFHVLEAERTKLRHGGLNLVRAAFRGYAALPPPSSSKPWWEVLMVDKNAHITVIEVKFKALAKKYHPDMGGDPNKMAELNNAYMEAKKEKS